MNRSLVALAVIVVAGLGLYAWTEVPRETTFETIETPMGTEEVMVTGGTRHSVPLDEIIGGGPPKDGIPSIDDPKYQTVGEVREWLNDDEPGIAISMGGVNRFYPYQILVWHEIVNDVVNGQRIMVTYCPLCLSGVVYDPVVDGERVEFGTSGKLWNSNLVMYDRKTDSYWSQVLGEAILGERTGDTLEILESDITRFGAWREKFPSGQVLSRDTGALRQYGVDPYGNYYSTEGLLFSRVNNTDDRLPGKDFVMGVVIDGQAKAYATEAVKAAGALRDEFAGKKIIVEYDPELDVVRLFEELPDGSRERINPLPNFWFSWVAAYPDTELYNG